MVRRLAHDPALAAAGSEGLAGMAGMAGLKTIIYGGAPMYLPDLEAALETFGPRLAQIYGQGETPMTITALTLADHGDRDHPQWRTRMQSVGTPRTDVEVRVVGPDGEDLPAGEPGEILDPASGHLGQPLDCPAVVGRPRGGVEADQPEATCAPGLDEESVAGRSGADVEQPCRATDFVHIRRRLRAGLDAPAQGHDAELPLGRLELP